MSRAGRRVRRQDGAQLLRRIDGGCDDCTAWTDLVSYGGGLIVLEVRHDDTCPAFAAYQREQDGNYTNE